MYSAQFDVLTDFAIGETFNRVLTRKKYLCRYVVTSLCTAEFSLIVCIKIASCSDKYEPKRPRGVDRRDATSARHWLPLCACEGHVDLATGSRRCRLHARHVTDVLQSLSSITEFPNLIATIQTLRNLNPLQVWHSLCSLSAILKLMLDAPRCSRLSLRGQRASDDRRMQPVPRAATKGLGKTSSQTRCRGPAEGGTLVNRCVGE